jgi:hypothetical protein
VIATLFPEMVEQGTSRSNRRGAADVRGRTRLRPRHQDGRPDQRGEGAYVRSSACDGRKPMVARDARLYGIPYGTASSDSLELLGCRRKSVAVGPLLVMATSCCPVSGPWRGTVGGRSRSARLRWRRAPDESLTHHRCRVHD